MVCATLAFVFFFNDTATPEIYTLSLHDALPIWIIRRQPQRQPATSSRPFQLAERPAGFRQVCMEGGDIGLDRKSTRLNSSHQIISYAVFCLKKKKKLNSKQYYF